MDDNTIYKLLAYETYLTCIISMIAIIKYGVDFPIFLILFYCPFFALLIHVMIYNRGIMKTDMLSTEVEKQMK